MNAVVESPVDRPEFRRIFVDTFSNEPSFKYMFPNEAARRRNAAWICDKTIKVKGGYFYALTTKDQIQGFSWWIAPGQFPTIGLREQLQSGYWRAPFKVGLRAFLRMYRFGAQEAKILRPYLNEPCWILDVIAVDPSAQRSGLGGRLMTPVFARADQQQLPCFVLTHNPRNVGFYEKYGFTLVLTEPLGKSGVSAYALVRKAR